MVEGARLESVYTLIAYRGFESLSLRQECWVVEYAVIDTQKMSPIFSPTLQTKNSLQVKNLPNRQTKNSSHISYPAAVKQKIRYIF